MIMASVDSEDLYHSQRKFQQCAEDVLCTLKQCPDISAEHLENIEDKLKNSMYDLLGWIDSLPKVVTVADSSHGLRPRMRRLWRPKPEHSQKFSITRVPFRKNVFADMEPCIVPIGGFKPMGQLRYTRRSYNQTSSRFLRSGLRERAGDVHISNGLKMKEVSIVLDKLPSPHVGMLNRLSDGQKDDQSDDTTNSDYVDIFEEGSDYTQSPISVSSSDQDGSADHLSWESWERKHNSDKKGLPPGPKSLEMQTDHDSFCTQSKGRVSNVSSESVPVCSEDGNDETNPPDSVNAATSGPVCSDITQSRLALGTLQPVCSPLGSEYDGGTVVEQNEPHIVSARTDDDESTLPLNPVDSSLSSTPLVSELPNAGMSVNDSSASYSSGDKSSVPPPTGSEVEKDHVCADQEDSSTTIAGEDSPMLSAGQQPLTSQDVDEGSSASTVSEWVPLPVGLPLGSSKTTQLNSDSDELLSTSVAKEEEEEPPFTSVDSKEPTSQEVEPCISAVDTTIPEIQPTVAEEEYFSAPVLKERLSMPTDKKDLPLPEDSNELTALTSQEESPMVMVEELLIDLTEGTGTPDSWNACENQDTGDTAVNLASMSPSLLTDNIGIDSNCGRENMEEDDFQSPLIHNVSLADSSEFFTAESDGPFSTTVSPLRGLRECAVSSPSPVDNSNLQCNPYSDGGTPSKHHSLFAEQECDLFAYRFDNPSFSVTDQSNDNSVVEDTFKSRVDTVSASEVVEKTCNTEGTAALVTTEEGSNVEEMSVNDSHCVLTSTQAVSPVKSDSGSAGLSSSPTLSPTSQGSLRRKSLKLLRKRRITSPLLSQSDTEEDTTPAIGKRHKPDISKENVSCDLFGSEDDPLEAFEQDDGVLINSAEPCSPNSHFEKLDDSESTQEDATLTPEKTLVPSSDDPSPMGLAEPVESSNSLCQQESSQVGKLGSVERQDGVRNEPNDFDVASSPNTVTLDKDIVEILHKDGETHSLDSETHLLDGETHPLDDETHSLDDETHSLDGETHPVDSDTNPVNGNTHPVDSETHPMDSDTHPVDSETHPVDSDTHPVDCDTHPVDSETHPVDSDTHPVDSDTHPVDCDTHPVDSDTHPVDSDTHPVDSDTHPVDSDTHPVDSDTHPVDSDTHPVDNDTHPVDSDTHPVDSDTHPVDSDTHSMDDDTHPVDSECHERKIKVETFVSEAVRNDHTYVSTTLPPKKEIPTSYHSSNSGSSAKSTQLTLRCVSCQRTMRERGKKKYRVCKKHKVLDVLQCKKCYNFYNSDSFTYDNGKQNECVVCGEGGEVVECDNSCPYSVCISCISRIEGMQRFNAIVESDAPFVCYSCKSAPIELYIQQYKSSKLYKAVQDSPCHSPLLKAEPLVNHSDKKCSSPLKVKLKGGSSSKEGTSVEEDAAVKKKQEDKDEQEDRGEEKAATSEITSGDSCSKGPVEEDSSSMSSTDVEDSEDVVKDKDIFSSQKKKAKTSLATIKVRPFGIPSDDPSDSEEQTVQLSDDDIPDNVVKVHRQKFTNRHTWLNEEDDDSEEEMSTSKKDDSVGEDSTADDVNNDLCVSDESSCIAKEESDQNAKEDTNSRATRKRRHNPLLSDSSGEEELSKHVQCIDSPKGIPSCLSSAEEESDLDAKALVSRQINMTSSNDSSDGDEDADADKLVKRKKVKKERITSDNLEEEEEEEEEDMNDILASTQANKEKRRKKMKSGIKRAKYIIFESDSDQEEEEDNDIIVLSDTDGSESGDDKSKAESTPGKKDSSMRRNIRKIMSNDKLALETRQAQKEEQERQKRLKERVQVDVEDRVIFEGTESNPVVEVRQELVKKLKPHQREGVKFLWNNTCEDLKTMQETPGSGAILAHCMGLGKTIQLIAFVDTLLCHKETGVKTVLIIVPKNTLSNWMAEFNLWAGDSEYHVFNFNDYSSKAVQFDLISSWHRRGGVGIISFTTYRNLTSNKGKASRKNKEKLLEYLRNPGPDIVVCDEGHLLKNYKSALSLTVNQIQTRRRIALTGTPLQNNLQEYYTMVSFVKPSLLGTLKEFNNRFGNPIKNGQCKDATAADVRTMKRRAHVLNYLLRNCVQRMDYRVLTTCLPGKHEYVVKVRLSEVQEKLYTTILYDNRSRGVMAIFKLFQSMMRIWNHPWMLKLYQQRKECELSDSEEDSDLGGFICNDSEAEEELMAIEAKHKKKKMKGKSKSSRPGSRSSLASTTSSASSLPSLSPMTYITLDDEDSPRLSPIVPKMPEDTSDQSPAAPTEWYHGILTDDMEYSLKVSAKLLFLKELLQETARLGEKVLLFSQSLLTLDTIEKFLQSSDFGSLTPELDYFRLDGSTGSHDRETMMKRFNKVGNKRIRLFLISTRAGSLGINLVSANRVVIFDACWNPSHDLQAIFRVYRYGQMKPVFIYRLIAKGTMEEKIYDRQVTKESTALRVIDDKQIDRHFSNADLQDILKYTPADLSEVNEKERPEADPVFCNILDHLQPGYLLSYHTHDSLLVHQQDEELTEDEKGKAWEEYQHILEGKAYYMAQTWQANVTETVQNGSFPATMIEGPQQLYPQGSGFRPIAAAQPQPQQQHYTILPNITAESQQNKYLDEWMRIVQHLHNYMGDVHEIYMQLQDAQRNHDAHRVNLLLQEIDRKMVMKHSNLTTIRESINQLASNPGLRGHPLLPTLNSAYAKAFQTWGEYRRTLQR